MHKKCITIAIIAVVVVGSGMFYAGIQYGKNKMSSQRTFRDGSGQNFQGGNRQMGQGAEQRTGGGNNNNQGDFSSGEIISKDDKSITIKTRDGGSKIIYFSDSTTIGKTTRGSVSDLNSGQSVVINGKSNSDGSIAAHNIQIRPEESNQQPE